MGGTWCPAGSPAPSPAGGPSQPCPPPLPPPWGPWDSPPLRSGKLIGGALAKQSFLFCWEIKPCGNVQRWLPAALGKQRAVPSASVHAARPLLPACAVERAGPGVRACGATRAAHATSGHARPCERWRLPSHSHGLWLWRLWGRRPVLVGGPESLPSLAQHGQPHSAWPCTSGAGGAGNRAPEPQTGRVVHALTVQEHSYLRSGRQQASPLGTLRPPRPLGPPLLSCRGRPAPQLPRWLIHSLPPPKPPRALRCPLPRASAVPVPCAYAVSAHVSSARAGGSGWSPRGPREGHHLWPGDGEAASCLELNGSGYILNKSVS